MDGDASINLWEVSQNAADDQSPLSCTPDCPQVEYVEEENDYTNEEQSNNNNQNNDDNSNFVQNDNEDKDITIEQNKKTSFSDDGTNRQSSDSQSFQAHVDKQDDSNVDDDDFGTNNKQLDIQTEDEQHQQHQQEINSNSAPSNNKSCPGANIDDCIEVCPAAPPLAFKYCVAECGKRCP